ncbi:MAG: acetyltransferase [Cyclobacteriaceae bacterium]|nr:acetyltransferase [Cyclobacteriaceae bacterium]
MTYSIEIPTKHDYPELIDVWEKSVRATHHFLPEEYIQYLKPLILEKYFDAVSLFSVRDEQKKIMGFMGTSDDKVEMLFIDPMNRGKGIGKLLMDYAIRNLRIRKVDVNEQNEQAVGFYKKLGFQVINRLEVDSLGKPYPILEMEPRKMKNV